VAKSNVLEVASVDERYTARAEYLSARSQQTGVSRQSIASAAQQLAGPPEQLLVAQRFTPRPSVGGLRRKIAAVLASKISVTVSDVHSVCV
jgi:hypothetical protein